MGNVVHMRDFHHGYSHLYRHALRGKPRWPDHLIGALWCVVWVEIVLLLILLGHILG